MKGASEVVVDSFNQLRQPYGPWVHWNTRDLVPMSDVETISELAVFIKAANGIPKTLEGAYKVTCYEKSVNPLSGLSGLHDRFETAMLQFKEEEESG